MNDVEIVVSGEALNSSSHEIPLSEARHLQDRTTLQNYLYDDLQSRLAKIRDEIALNRSHDLAMELATDSALSYDSQAKIYYEHSLTI